MKQAEIKKMNNVELLGAFYWHTVKVVHEENSVRGMSQKSKKIEQWIINELGNRFILDTEELNKLIYSRGEQV